MSGWEPNGPRRPEPREDEPPAFEKLFSDLDPAVYEHGRDYEPIHPQPAWRAVVKKLWAPLAALAFLFWKFKFVVFAIFKLKIFATAGTMLVSTAAYAWIWGWQFAVGFVVLLFVHEMGHVIELRRQGVPASAPLFIPFLGAVVGMKQLPDDAWKEARVALAGPLLGSAGAAVTWGIGEALDSELLVALAFVGFLLNLFNLIPIVPLDGGRAVAALHPAIWLVGLAGIAGLTVVAPNPILFLVLILGGLEAWKRWQHRGDPEQARYFRIPTWQRVTVGITYGGLAVLLALGMSATHIEKDF